MRSAVYVLWLAIVVTGMYLLFSAFTLHQCHADPVVTPGSPGYDCATMSGYCTDTGTQGGTFRTPGVYNKWGQWQAPLPR